LIALAAEITGIDVEDGGDVVQGVADRNGLRVEFEESHSFVVKHGCAQIRHQRTSRWRTRRLRRDGGSSSRVLSWARRWPTASAWTAAPAEEASVVSD